MLIWTGDARFMRANQMTYSFIDDAARKTRPAGEGRGLYRRYGKRVLDIALVMASLPFVLPVIFLAWAAMVRSGRPGFYRQPRVGRGGNQFTCWKIRTMAPDADRILAEHLRSDPKIAEEWEKTQKLKDDPRITRTGRLLRRTSIDELPQLWNVLRGEMSLIGPRPFTPAQKALYDEVASKRSYYALRPGLTGLWQVESRNQGEFKDRVAYDEAYGERLSFVEDMRIVLRTVSVVLRATGQ